MEPIFRIDKSNENRIKYVIFGMKISMYRDNCIADYLLKPFKKIINYFRIKFFIRAHNSYRMRGNKSVKRRLIITTGNISLINAIAVLNQLSKKDSETKYEDYLYIWTINKNPEFRSTCDKIASLYPFKKIYHYEDSIKRQSKAFSNKYHVSGVIKDFLKLNLYKTDDIIATNVVQNLKPIKELYPQTKFYLIDESAYGRCPKCNLKYYKNVINFIMPKYLDKIDYLDFTPDLSNKFIDLDKQEFLNVSEKCVKMFPINIESNPEDKIIIFCGTWGNIGGYNSTYVHNLEMQLVEKLCKQGYKILFKPHPRDITEYQENELFKIFRSRLPLECYHFENVVATVSLISYSSLQSYYYNNIPGFVYYFENDIYSNVSSALIKEYTPNLKELLKIDINNMTLKEVKDYIEKLYLDFLNPKPLLSQNELLINLYREE